MCVLLSNHTLYGHLHRLGDLTAGVRAALSPHPVRSSRRLGDLAAGVRAAAPSWVLWIVRLVSLRAVDYHVGVIALCDSGVRGVWPACTPYMTVYLVILLPK